MSNIPSNWNDKFKSNLTGNSFPNGLTLRDLLYDYYFQLSSVDANVYLDEEDNVWKFEDSEGYNYLINFISWLNNTFGKDFTIPTEMQFLNSIPNYRDIGLVSNPNDLVRWTIPVVRYITNLLSCFIQSDGIEKRCYFAGSGDQIIAEKDIISDGLPKYPFNMSRDYWSYAPDRALINNNTSPLKIGMRIFTFDSAQSQPITDFALPILHNAYDLFSYLSEKGISVDLDDTKFSTDDDPLIELSNFTSTSAPCTLCQLKDRRPYRFEYAKTPPGSNKDFGAYNATKDWGTVSSGSFVPVNDDSYLLEYHNTQGEIAPMVPVYGGYQYVSGNMDTTDSEYYLPSSYKVKFKAPIFSEMLLKDIFVFPSNWIRNLTPRRYTVTVTSPNWSNSKLWSSYNVVTGNTDSNGNSHLTIGIPKTNFVPTKTLSLQGSGFSVRQAEMVYLDIGLSVKSSAKASGGAAAYPEYQPSTVYLLVNVFDAWKNAFKTTYLDDSDGLSKEDFQRVLLNGIQNATIPIIDQFDSFVETSDIHLLNDLLAFAKTPHDTCVELKSMISGRILTIGTLLSEITSWSNSEVIGFNFEKANARLNTSGGNFVDSILNKRSDLITIYYSGSPVGNTLYEVYYRIKNFQTYNPDDISVDHISSCLQWLSSEYVKANKISLKQEVYSSIALNSEDQSTFSNNLNSIMKDIKSQYDREYNSLMNTIENQSSKSILSTMYLDLINYFSELEVTLNNNSFGDDMSSGDIYANVLKHDLEVIDDYGVANDIQDLDQILTSIPDESLFIVPTESILSRMWNDINNYVISPIKTFIKNNISSIIQIPYKLLATGLWYIGNYLCSDGKAFSVNKKYSHGVLGVPITQSRIKIPSYISNNVSFSFMSYGCIMTLPFSIMHVTVDPYDTNTILVSQYMRLDHATINMTESTPDVDFLAIINEHIPGLIADLNLLHFFVDSNFSGRIFPTGLTPESLYANKYELYVKYINEHNCAVLAPSRLNSIHDVLESSKSQYLDSRYASTVAAGVGGSLASIALLGAWPIGTIVGIAGLGATAYGVYKECEEVDKLYNTKIQEWPYSIKKQMDLTINNADVSHALYNFSRTFSNLTNYGSDLYDSTNSCIAVTMTNVLASKEISVFNPESIDTLYCSSPLSQSILPRYYLSQDSDIQAKARSMYILIGAALSLLIFRKPIGRFLTMTASALAGLITGSINKSVGVAWATKSLNESIQQNLPGVIGNPVSEVQTSINTMKDILDRLQQILGDIKDVNDKPIIYN